MKKTYVAPKVEVMELDVEVSMMSMSALGEGGLDDTSWGGESEGGMEADANNRRGEWGNLWAEKSIY